MIIPFIYTSYADLKAGTGSYRLPDVVSIPVVEERNGAFELEMRYLFAGKNADKIALEKFIMAVPQHGQDPEPFRVSMITTPIDGVITVKAHHISYDLSGVVLQPFIKYSVSTVIAEVNRQFSALGADFELVNDGIVSSDQFSISYPQTAASVLGQGKHCLVETYGAELSYAWDPVNQKEIITLHAARGVQSSATVAYGFNLLKLDSTVNSDSVYSSIYPYAKVTENNVTTLFDLPEKTIPTGATTTMDRTLLVDLSPEFDDAPTEAELRAKANEYIASIDWNAQETCTVEFVPLQNTTDYQGQIEEQIINLCDTVLIDASVIGVKKSAKVVKTVYNQMSEKYDSMTVGMIQPSIADTIAGLSGGGDPVKSLNAKYLPLSGGTVSGDLNITGGLTVSGKAIAAPSANSVSKDTSFNASPFSFNVRRIAALGFAYAVFNIGLPSLSAQTFYTMCTIPSGYRPSSDIYFTLAGQRKGAYLLTITAATGEVKIYSDADANSQFIRGSIVYPS